MINRHYDDWLDCELDTEVVCSYPDKAGYWIRLRDTVFYPEKGGMKKDRGWINNHEIIDLKEENGVVYHLIDQELAGRVHLTVDKEDRKKRAMIHSGQHLMCGIINKKHHAKTIAFFNDEYEAGAEMGFDRLDESTINAIEDDCNRCIEEDLPVIIKYPTKEEAADFVIEEKLSHDELRAVIIGDIDYNMCSCIHVPSLRFLKGFIITRFEKTTRGYKIFFLCGNQLLNTTKKYHDQLRILSHQLAAPFWESEKALEHLNNECLQLKKTNEQLSDQLLSDLAAGLCKKEEKIIVQNFSDLKPKQLTKLASIITKNSCKIVIFTTQNENKMHLLMAKHKDLPNDLVSPFNDLKQIYHIKGGGNPFILQGGLDYDPGIIDKLEAVKDILDK